VIAIAVIAMRVIVGTRHRAAFHEFVPLNRSENRAPEPDRI